MADAIKFPGSNFTFTAPPERDDVRDLHTFRQPGGPCNVSCWQLRPEELDEVNRTGRVFLSVMSGLQFYPAFVGAESVVRSVVVDYGKVWDRGPWPPAPAPEGGLPRALFAANFIATEDPTVVAEKWQDWPDARRKARVQAACARSYALSAEAIGRAIEAMTPLVSEDMDENMRRAWLTDLATVAINAALATGEAGQ
ncbi:hypothetical protein [Sphingopyxis sp. 113P3]|uniref:hypothetical protein n=1 Tax=Sphingopyxis sp. (strain 113P3) TaxID=292913 RepID=UPI0006AD20C9|nr:hypothetical protein [Sphingopyxis sp. 113P3]ALC13799.1 hypothetical protein LH20_17720 [Sphingopyxis sp. 113P3]